MLTFLLSPIGRIVGYAVGILALLGLVLGFYEIKIAEAKAQALASFNQQQLEQTLKDQQTYVKQLKALEADKQTLQAQNDALEAEVSKLSDAANQTIGNSKDIQADPLFNDVLKELKGKTK